MTAAPDPTDVNGLLLSTAQLLARQIQDELLRSVSSRELTLLSDYLSACRNAAGPIVAVNDELSGSPEKVNESPYEGGWLFQIEVTEEGELLDAAGYEAQAN